MVPVITYNRYIYFDVDVFSVTSEVQTPLGVYMSRVKAGQLNEDDFQKSVVASLDRLNEQVKDYRPPEQGNIFMQKVCNVIRYNINVCVQK